MLFALLLLYVLHTSSQITKDLPKPTVFTSQISRYVKICSLASAATISGEIKGGKSTILKGKAVTIENIAS